MSSNLNALTMRISADTSGLQAGVKLTRSEIGRLNRIERMAKTDTDRLRESTELLRKGFNSGAIDVVQFVKQMDFLESRYRTGTAAAKGNEAQLSRVQSLVKASTPETAKLAMQIRELRKEQAAGNITAAEFARTNETLRQRYQQARTEARGLTDEQQRLAAAQRVADERMRSVQSVLTRMTPETTRLAVQIRDLRKEYEAGNVSAQRFARANQELRARYLEARQSARVLTDEQQRLAAIQTTLQERMARVRQTIEGAVPPTQRLARQMAELRLEYNRGNVSIHEYNATLRSLQTQQAATNAGFAGAASGLAAISRWISPIVIGYAAISEAQRSIGAALDMEQTAIEFEVLAGSASRGAALLGQARNFAASTPLSFEAVSQGAKTLLTYGVAAEDVMGHLRRLGDISGGSAERLGRLTYAFGQVTQAGRLTGSEARQLSEVGFGPLEEMARTTGEDMLVLKKRMEAGAISVADFYEAIKSVTSEGGRFHEMMERLGDTNTAKINELKEEIDQLRISFGSNLTGDFATGATYMSSGIKLARGEIDRVNEATDGWLKTFNGLNTPIGLLLRFGSSAEQIKQRQEAAAAAAKDLADSLAEASNETERLSEVAAASPPVNPFGDEGKSEADSMIHRLRLANLELRKGKEYAEEFRLSRAGALPDQLTELRMLTSRNAALEKAKKLEKDRTEAIAKAKSARAKEVDEMKQAGQDFAESVRSPFAELVETLRKLRDAQARGELSASDSALSIKAAQAKFRDDQKPVKVELPPSAQRGSVEEYQQVAKIFSANRSREEQQHRERMAIMRANEMATREVVQAVRDADKLVGV